MKTIFLLFVGILLSMIPFSIKAQILQLASQDFQEKLENEYEYQLVDVRPVEEYKESHIKDALNIEYQSEDFNTLIDQLNKNKPVFIYCLSGLQSEIAVKVLEEKCFTNVYDLKGGILKWKEEGRPVESFRHRNGLSKQEFEKIVQDNKLVLVDFGAKWCGPCKKMGPTIERLSSDKEMKTKVVKIDVDENEQLSQALNIDALPTLQIYKNNKMVWQMIGYMNETDLRNELKKHID